MSNLNTVMSQAAAAGTAPDGAWDLSYAYFDDPFAWDLSTAVYLSKSFSVAGQETGTRGVSLSPDGTKMYIVGVTGDDVNQYTLSTPFLVSSATYVQNFSVSSQEPSPSSVFFKTDGTKMYISGTSSDRVNEYDLSTAWDVSTASYLQNLSVTPQVNGVFIRSDGLKMYTVDSSTDRVYEYDLSTAWDVTTASVLQNLSVGAQESTPEGLSFKSDGTKMFVLGNTGDDVTEYDLSTAWDISTATVSTTFSVSGQDSNSRGLFIGANGGYMYVVGATAPSTVYQYSLGGFNVGTQEQTIEGIFFKPDGTKLYICGTAGDEVNEYDLSTAWDLSTASFLQALNVYSQTRDPASLFFKPDGTVMYVASQQLTKTIFYYSLSSPWDISTAVFATSITIGTEVASPTGVFFKPDGTKMYVSGSSGDDVNEYDLSTAWDVGTATYSQNFSVAAQDTSPQEVFFKDDGTKMYILGDTNNKVYEYELSTAWDVSTASYIKDFFINNSGGSLRGGLFFKPDGTKMYLGDFQTDSIYSYTLGVQE